jgi:hypothetical protein
MGQSDGKTTGSRPFVHSGPPAFCLTLKPGILGICGTPDCFILNSFVGVLFDRLAPHGTGIRVDNVRTYFPASLPNVDD